MAAASHENLKAPVRATQTTEEAFAQILRVNFAYVTRWEAISHEGKEIEGVHQMRVGLRRMRSALSVFRRAIPRPASDTIGEEMRWAANALGPARDLDVFITEGLTSMAGKIPLTAGEQQMKDLAQKHREEAYIQVREMIDSDRYKKFKEDLTRWIDEKEWNQAELADENRKRIGQNIVSFAVKILDKRLTLVLTDGARIGEMSLEELHMLRIECKKLRYATEFLGPLFGKNMSGFSLRLKEVQAILGLMNDVAVMPGLLAKVTAGENDPDLMQYLGALIGWRSRQLEEARGHLNQAWANFAAAEVPWKMPIQEEGTEKPGKAAKAEKAEKQEKSAAKNAKAPAKAEKSEKEEKAPAKTEKAEKEEKSSTKSGKAEKQEKNTAKTEGEAKKSKKEKGKESEQEIATPDND